MQAIGDVAILSEYHLNGFDAAVVDTFLHIREHEGLNLSIDLGSGRIAGPYLKKRKATRLVADFGDDNVARSPGIEAQLAQLSQWLLLNDSLVLNHQF
jgi:hypothetical protein